MDIFIYASVIFAAYCFGIRVANNLWIHKADKDQRIECRGKLYKVQESE